MLGEKAVISSQVKLRLFCKKFSEKNTMDPSTPTPLIQRQDSSFTSTDSKRCLFNGNSHHGNNIV